MSGHTDNLTHLSRQAGQTLMGQSVNYNKETVWQNSNRQWTDRLTDPNSQLLPNVILSTENTKYKDIMTSDKEKV